MNILRDAFTYGGNTACHRALVVFQVEELNLVGIDLTGATQATSLPRISSKSRKSNVNNEADQISIV